MGSLRDARRLVAGLTALAALTVPAVLTTAGPALAATPLPAPGTPVTSEVTTTSVTISWSAPAGPVAGYTVQGITGSSAWRSLTTTTTATTFAHTGLTPDTVYIYRVFAEPVAGSDHTTSAPSGLLYVRTQPLPDSVPPTTPGPFIMTTSLSLRYTGIHFTASTDNRRVAGYWLQRMVDGAWTDWATNDISTVYLRDLTPGTSYTVVAVAFDANGNRSPRTAPFTFTTRQLEPRPTCRVTLRNFGNNYLLDGLIENMTDATVLENWTFRFALPTAHLVTYTTFGALQRTGDQATGVPPVWFGALRPGGTFAFTIMGQYPAGSPLPSGFTVDSAGADPLLCG